ncbi:MAG: TorF family putative porin [Pseudomonadota bacterium]|nr:TorF family putative porin [Pseudomonadota bacterium]
MTFKRSVLSAVVLGASVFSGSVLAGATANVGVTSQYLFRGIEQTSGAAVSGGFDYAAESGLYVGTWASTIGFASATGTSAEIDFYAGFSGKAGDFGYDIGGIYYYYSEEEEGGVEVDPSNNTIEIYGSVSFGPAKLGVNYSVADYFAVTDEAVIYPYLKLSFPVAEKATLDVSVGQQTFDDDALEDILDYSIGVSASAGNGFSMGLAAIATDIDEDDVKFVLSGKYGFDL